MTSELRRTLDELVVLYELEPGLRDLYVEGDTDLHFFRWFLRRAGLRDFRVYSIRSVHIEEHLLANHAMCGGNKARVLETARHLSSSLSAQNYRHAFVVDRDFDTVLGETRNVVGGLFVTDYSCLESYAYSSDTLQKFFELHLYKDHELGRLLPSRWAEALLLMFSVRAVVQRAVWKRSWATAKRIPFTPQCTFVDHTLRFDLDMHATKLLNKNAWPITKLAFVTEVRGIAKQLHADARNSLHGHDFLELLAHFARTLKVKAPYSADKTVARGLLTCLDHGQLCKEPLFSSLLSRLR